MSDVKPERKIGPPQGSPGWYIDFFDKLKNVKVMKVDKEWILTNVINSESAAGSIISGLKFLGIINEDGSTTEKVKSLDIEGPEYTKNFEIIIRESYSIVFNTIKQIEKATYTDILNCFKSSSSGYGMAPSTALQASKIFISLARRTNIQLSDEVLEKQRGEPERKKEPKTKEGNKTGKKSTNKDVKEDEPLSSSVIARLTLNGTGHIDIKNKEDFEVAEAMWKILAKRVSEKSS
jgi:hypothetical protein